MKKLARCAKRSLNRRCGRNRIGFSSLNQMFIAFFSLGVCMMPTLPYLCHSGQYFVHKRVAMDPQQNAPLLSSLHQMHSCIILIKLYSAVSSLPGGVFPPRLEAVQAAAGALVVPGKLLYFLLRRLQRSCDGQKVQERYNCTEP